MGAPEQVTLRVEGDHVLATGSTLLQDRRARLFFASILGAERTADGWRCPRRQLPISDLVIRINTYLETKGWQVERVGAVDDEVQRTIERKRSFERAREAAVALRQGQSPLDVSTILEVLAKFGWDSTARPLLPHQEAGARHALTAVSAANFSVPGSGKTATALAVAAAHLASDTVEVVMVVGPLACFAPWEHEADAALPGKLRARRVRGTADQRRQIYASTRKLDLLLTSYAGAAADKSQLIDLCRRHRVMLVVDESHRIKRFRGGTWAPALLEIARHARVKLILSGTPMPQSGRDLYSQLNILWPSGELTGPRDQFGVRVDQDFESVLRTVQPFVSRAPKEALGLPPYHVIRHDVAMDNIQEEIYLLIEGNFRRRLEDAHQWQEKLAALRRGRPIRLLQAASNPDVLNRADGFYSLPRMVSPNSTLMERLSGYRSAEVPTKSRAALDLVRDMASRGEKAVVWSNFLLNLDQFTQLVRSESDVPAFQVDGRIPTGDEASDERSDSPPYPQEGDTRERIIERFLSAAGPAVLVTNPASCSESISLHRSCHNAIYLDRTYDCALFLQSIDRIHRLGLPNGVTVTVHLLHATVRSRSTCDHLVDRALSRKEAAMRQLLEGAEINPLGASQSPLESAEGNDEDLAELLRFLLGEQQNGAAS
jgi:hypothetical protein